MDPTSQQSEQEPEQEQAPPAPTCRHEFVRIYQRKLKGIERRLVSTKAYLPVGFKMADFGHLSEGSYCFCTKCRARLFPKRTAAEKVAARQALLAKQALAQEAMLKAEMADGADEGVETPDALESDLSTQLDEDSEGSETKSAETSARIHVEELEIDALELEEISESSEIEESDDEEA